MGLVGLLTLTQAGNLPQQLPTSLTMQSASVRQVVFTWASLIGDTAGRVAASVGGAVTQPIRTRDAIRNRLLRHQDKARDMWLLRSR
ncbi:hypothetical protein ASF90_13360 [Xanthomonas sp. Leaf148]|nr:hypothetical protein ASF90_13360 [Xanthomonas sp. Leaf148]